MTEVLQTLKARETVKGEITLLIGKAEEQDVTTAAVGRQGDLCGWQVFVPPKKLLLASVVPLVLG